MKSFFKKKFQLGGCDSHVCYGATPSFHSDQEVEVFGSNPGKEHNIA